MTLSLSPTFLADLAEVHGALGPQLEALSSEFLSDLDLVYASLVPASEVNILLLERRFDDWRRHTQEFLRSHLAELPADDPVLCPISLFRTMDYGRLETAHTRTLAWLLNPRREHGFGEKLLAALLPRLGDRDNFDALHVQYVTSEHQVAGLDEKGRLDVLAEGTWDASGGPVPWMLVIEAKIGAAEGEDQLVNYDKWLQANAAGRKVLRVFLTADGHPAESNVAKWEPLSFLDLVRIIRTVYGELGNAPGLHFLRFYLAGVLQDICGWPRRIIEAPPDPYALASYLKTIRDSPQEESRHASAW